MGKWGTISWSRGHCNGFFQNLISTLSCNSYHPPIWAIPTTFRRTSPAPGLFSGEFICFALVVLCTRAVIGHRALRLIQAPLNVIKTHVLYQSALAHAGRYSSLLIKLLLSTGIARAMGSSGTRRPVEYTVV